MKKVGAILAAVAMVVAAFVIRGGGDDNAGADDDRADDVSTLVCPEDFLPLCRTIRADVETVMTPAGTTADLLLTATGDDDALVGEAWVIPAAWADLVLATRAFDGQSQLFEISEPFASTRVALAIYESEAADLDCAAIDWGCLATAAAAGLDVGSPPMGSALGLPIAAAQVVQIAGSVALDPSEVRLPPFGREASAYDAMRTQGPGKFAAVGTTEAQTAGRSASGFGEITVSPQPSDVRIDLVVVTRVGADLPDDVREAIAEAFLDADWDRPGTGPSGMPHGDLLNVIRNS